MLSPFQFPDGSVWRHYKGNKYFVLGVAAMTCDRDMKEGTKFALWVTYDQKKLGDFVTCILCEPEQNYEGHGVFLGHADYTGSKTRGSADEPLIVYIGLYDNPKGNRLCMRPLSEWDEMVYPESAQFSGEARVQRYVKVDA